MKARISEKIEEEKSVSMMDLIKDSLRNHENINGNNRNQGTSMAFQMDNILCDTVYKERLLNTDAEGNIIFLSFLKDKVYQVYNKHLRISKELIKIGKELFQSNRDKTNENFRPQAMIEHKRVLTDYVFDLPGFDKILSNDLALVLCEKLFYIFGIRHNDLIINDECYLVESESQISTKWMEKTHGRALVEYMIEFHRIFNALNLTYNEISLIIPIILTTPFSNYFQNYY